MSLLRSNLNPVQTKEIDMEHSLTTWLHKVTCLPTKVSKFQSDVLVRQKKCLDMEGRMRQSDSRILNVPEEAGPDSPSIVSKLLREVFDMEKDVTIDILYRSSQQLDKAKGKFHPIIAKLNYHQYCVDVLR